MIGSGGIPEDYETQWRAFIDDLEATAEEYEARGYEVVAIHPGDVVPLEDTATLDVLAPGSEFEAARALRDDFDVDEFTVYNATEGVVRFALIVAEDHTNEAAICCPVFLREAMADEFLPALEEAGFLQINIRPLSDDDQVVLRIEEPEIVFE